MSILEAARSNILVYRRRVTAEELRYLVGVDAVAMVNEKKSSEVYLSDRCLFHSHFLLEANHRKVLLCDHVLPVHGHSRF